MTERWLPVPGFPNYEVSSEGRVRSLDHMRRCGPYGMGLQKGRVLRAGVGGNGYLIVARAFLGECPAGLVCCHNDGDKLNPRVENLRYDTRAANNADEYRHGKRDAVRDSQRSKKAVATIKARYGDDYFRRLGAKPTEYDL